MIFLSGLPLPSEQTIVQLFFLLVNEKKKTETLIDILFLGNIIVLHFAFIPVVVDIAVTVYVVVVVVV